MLHVEFADLARSESRRAVQQLLAAYLLETECEKAVRGLASAANKGVLPPRYQAEVDDPETVLAGSSVLTASTGSEVQGVVVVTRPHAGVCKIKRLWVDPNARGAGVGTVLLESAISAAKESGAAVLRLTVWAWRESAIRAYRKLGFQEVESWDERIGLVCMELKLTPLAHADWETI
jgi:ribosomal protein S18 acetylase RimI-like enzyme